MPIEDKVEIFPLASILKISVRVVVFVIVAGDAVVERVIVDEGVIEMVRVDVIVEPVEARMVIVGRDQLLVHFFVLDAAYGFADCECVSVNITPRNV